MKYLICYDIREARVRARVAKLLEERARRLQYSVFMGEFTECECELLRSALLGIMETSEKSHLLIVPLCRACAARVFKYGEALEETRRCVVA